MTTPIALTPKDELEEKQAEISRRSLEAHAELAKMTPTPTPEEIKAFRNGEPAPNKVAAHPAQDRSMQAKPSGAAYETRSGAPGHRQPGQKPTRRLDEEKDKDKGKAEEEN